MLDLQKGDEFRSFVMRDSNVSPDQGRVTLTKQEAEWESRNLELAVKGNAQGGASGDRGPRANRDSDAAKFVKDLQRPYAHPYFWVRFLLMSNWK